MADVRPAADRSALARVSSAAILVGHSYGGTLITAAGTDPRVAGLVYIAAFAADANEISQSQQAKFPVTDVFSYVEVTDGRVWLKPEGIACFAGDLPEEEQKLLWATHAAPAADLQRYVAEHPRSAQQLTVGRQSARSSLIGRRGTHAKAAVHRLE